MKGALELIPGELQGVSLDEPDIARAAATAQTMNRTVLEAADKLLQFEDEPGAYLAFLGKRGERA
jgi:hypothetical protein